mmetsp:Transcript_39438/g.63948  ORF Transcript_39438/g.63948 Transcript_39438/m.63948 type:complete len:81 (-) Transcript_39438:303-545(-)
MEKGKQRRNESKETLQKERRDGAEGERGERAQKKKSWERRRRRRKSIGRMAQSGTRLDRRRSRDLTTTCDKREELENISE